LLRSNGVLALAIFLGMRLGGVGAGDDPLTDGGPVVVVRDDALVGLLDPEHVGAVVAMRGGTWNASRS